MPKRKVTPAKIAADAKYKASVKQITLQLKTDSEILAWLRSQVNNDRELPHLVKQIIAIASNN
jgi:hypothetical protein